MIDYFEDVKKIISRQYEIDDETIEEDSELEADFKISELDMEDLVAILQEKYDITIPESDYSKFKTVSDITTYLYENVDQA